MPFQAAGEPGLTGKPNRQLNRLWHWLQEKDGSRERERGSAQGMGALDRGGPLKCRCDPWFSLGGAQLGGQDRPGGGGQLTLLALGGELGCQLPPPPPPPATRPIPQPCLRKQPLWLKNWAKVEKDSQILPTETTVVP